ncbi:MAG: 3-oxoacid CoA-transferase subunit B [Pseudomonadota bacterium]|nr:3-oxoacid CoA-transferase subunit B [Pseudomonadota bacterium]
MVEALNRNQVAWRVANDFEEGAFVNLGVGMPLNVLNYVPEGREIIFHSENGVLGMKSLEDGEEPNPDLINAGKQPISMLLGGAFFHHSDSFAMVRGGHIDVCVLGAYEVAENGDLANWRLPHAKTAPAVGGAMDLAYGARRVYVMCDHNGKDGSSKIVKECSLPLTGAKCVTKVFTDLAVIELGEDGMVVREMAEGLKFDRLQERTGAELRLANDWQTLSVPDIAPPEPPKPRKR